MLDNALMDWRHKELNTNRRPRAASDPELLLLRLPCLWDRPGEVPEAISPFRPCKTPVALCWTSVPETDEKLLPQVPPGLRIDTHRYDEKNASWQRLCVIRRCLEGARLMDLLALQGCPEGRRGSQRS